MKALDSSIEAFLDAYPLMRSRPSAKGTVRLVGRLEFSAVTEGAPLVEDEYRIQMDISSPLDRALPQVFEVGGRIPREGRYHVNPDGTLCLGSMLRQRLILGAQPSLVDFVDKCVVPFLYGHSLRESGAAELPFGELEHGAIGLVDDYRLIFGIADRDGLQGLMRLLAMKRRRANKLRCYCGCGRRFAACSQHRRAHALRRTLTRLDIKRAYEEIWPTIV